MDIPAAAHNDISKAAKEQCRLRSPNPGQKEQVGKKCTPSSAVHRPPLKERTWGNAQATTPAMCPPLGAWQDRQPARAEELSTGELRLCEGRKRSDVPPCKPETWTFPVGDDHRPLPAALSKPPADSLADLSLNCAPAPGGLNRGPGEEAVFGMDIGEDHWEERGDDDFVLEVDLGLEEPEMDVEPPASWAKLTEEVPLSALRQTPLPPSPHLNAFRSPSPICKKHRGRQLMVLAGMEPSCKLLLK